MTKGSMDEMTEQKEESIISRIKAFIQSPSEAPLADGVFTGLSTYGLMEAALKKLRDLTKKGIITWKEPFIQLEYDFDVKDRLAFVKEHLEYLSLVYLTKGFTITKEAGSPNIITNTWKENIEGLTEEQLAAGFEPSEIVQLSGTAVTPDGTEDFAAELLFAIRPLIIDKTHNKTFYPIHTGIMFRHGNPSTWSEDSQTALWNGFLNVIKEKAAPYTKELKAKGEGLPSIPKSSRAIPIRPENFPVAGGYVRPMYGLSEAKKDLPLLLEFHEPQTPLNWAVGLAMFSLTNEDRVKTGDWQEATIKELEDRVFCLTEQDALSHGQHREDILAEVVKLHTTRNWYYEIDTVKVGKAWTKRATIGSQYAIPEIKLIFLDTKTGKKTFPDDPSIRKLLIPLEVKGRRIAQPDGKDIPSLPKGRWQIDSIRWRWVQAFNDDLLLMPALVESGRKKGLPKKTTTGKTIRKGYLIRVADNVFSALGKLRAEGSGSKYACRLLIMLASNINKTESGIKADRVFRMVGIPEDYQKRNHEKPEEVIARAVLRLKGKDIRALLAGSDEYPRTDPNLDRRKGPYYRFKRSLEYTPRTGITSKENALAIEAEYESTPKELPPESKAKIKQTILPGIIEDAPTIPSGSEIRSAREAAGVNLRDFARIMEGPSFKTWSMIETGQRSKSIGRIKAEVWKRVREFIAQHEKKGL